MIKSALVVLATMGILSTMHGPFSVTDQASGSSPLLDCFAADERDAGLEDGIGGVIVARYVNAARFAKPDGRVVVDMDWNPPGVQPAANNLAWFDDGYRHDKHPMNFVATHLLTKEALAFVRARVGSPQRVYHCPSTIDARPAGHEELDLWVYDSAEQQARLAALVARDPMANAFIPRRGARAFRFDPEWAMFSPNDEAKISEKSLLWQRSTLQGDHVVALTKSMFLPSGHYRVRLDAVATNTTSIPAQVRVVVTGKELGRATIDPSRTSTTLEFDVLNKGGATSGEYLTLVMTTGDATELRIDGAELELREARGVDLFRLFR